MSAGGDGNKKPMSIIVTKDTLNRGLSTLHPRRRRAAMGDHPTMFFAVCGLSLLRKKLDLQISPLGNPAMKMPTPGKHFASFCRTTGNELVESTPDGNVFRFEIKRVV